MVVWCLLPVHPINRQDGGRSAAWVVIPCDRPHGMAVDIVQHNLADGRAWSWMLLSQRNHLGYTKKACLR
jgi:hypothetical protein